MVNLDVENIKKNNIDKRKLEQIPLKHENLDELKKVIKFLKDKGYKILHGLNNLKEGDHIVAAVIDIEEKSVRTTNITCMARWCDFKRKPLSVDHFINNYDRLVVEKDEEFYNTLIEINKN